MSEVRVVVGAGTDRVAVQRAIEFLNSRGVRVNTRGTHQPLSGQTVIAMAELVRAFDRMKEQGT